MAIRLFAFVALISPASSPHRFPFPLLLQLLKRLHVLPSTVPDSVRESIKRFQEVRYGPAGRHPNATEKLATELRYFMKVEAGQLYVSLVTELLCFHAPHSLCPVICSLKQTA